MPNANTRSTERTVQLPSLHSEPPYPETPSAMGKNRLANAARRNTGVKRAAAISWQHFLYLSKHFLLRPCEFQRYNELQVATVLLWGHKGTILQQNIVIDCVV